MATGPGTTLFTRTLGAHSTARLVARWCRPALAAPYAAVSGDGRVPLTLPIMVIEPPSGWSCITALAAWATCSGAIRFSSMTLACSRGDAVAAAAAGDPPALLTTTSSRPNRSAASPTSRWACPGSLTSARVKTAVRPPAPGSEAASDGSVRPHTSTCAPASRKARAMPAPMPLVPPVTITARPA